MKLILTLAILTFGAHLYCQVTYEQSYENSFDSQMWITSIEEGNEKYLQLNRLENEFHLYNLDHSLYLTVEIPVTLGDNYNIGYVTSSLFDCDDSNIEYTIMAQSSTNYNFYIYREDGALIWSMDSVLAPYCFGCNTGSVVNQPIKNTSDGAKLFLLNSDYSEIGVYALCGELPTDVFEFAQTNQLVQVFPNPSSESLNFNVISPSNTEQSILTITNSESKIVEHILIDANGIQRVDVSDWGQGTFFYSLKMKNEVLQTGKFQIVR